MSINSSKTAAFGMAAAMALIIIPAGANANSIGINFEGNHHGGSGAYSNTSLASGTYAGVVSQDNWNNLLPPTGEGTNPYNPGATLVDNTGTSTTAGISWGFGPGYDTNTWARLSSSSTGLTPTETLLNGLLTADAGGTVSITMSNIAYANYDLIVYLDGNSGTATNPNPLTVTNGSSSSTFYAAGATSDYSTYSQISSTVVGSPQSGDYVQYDNLTGSTFTFSDSGGGGNRSIYGLQIVAVPEPASLALLAAAGFGTLLLRRKKPSVAL